MRFIHQNWMKKILGSLNFPIEVNAKGVKDGNDHEDGDGMHDDGVEFNEGDVESEEKRSMGVMLKSQEMIKTEICWSWVMILWWMPRV